MDGSFVLKKTDAGRVALNDKNIGISRIARTALIMIDGVKTADAIMKVLPGGVAAARDALNELHDALLIEQISAAPARASGTASVVATSSAASTVSALTQAVSPTADFASVRKDATKRLSNMLGPFGDDAAMRIERARDVAGLRSALEDAARVVQNLKSRAAAEDFLAQTRDLLRA